MNDDAVGAVASSIKNFGFKNPIIIDKENEVINGHTRLKAAKKLGMKKVPVIVADDLTPEQIKAFRLADNKVAEIAEWDEDLLAIELEELGNLDIDMSLFGFDEEEKEEEKEEEVKADVEFTEELGEANNYIVLKFETDVDWLQAQTLFDLKTKKALDSKKGFEKKGIGRVLDGAEVINKILGEI